MVTGHFGLAVGVKQFAPRLPMWTLMLATFWLDIIFIILSVFGFESYRPMDPARPRYGEIIIDALYTHSLVGAMLIAIVTGWFASLRWKREGGLVTAAVVFSHWLLDLLVHRPDLPILPGNIGDLPLLGFGLWSRPLLSGFIELVLALSGAYFYFLSTTALNGNQPRRARMVSVITGALLLLLFLTNVMGL